MRGERKGKLASTAIRNLDRSSLWGLFSCLSKTISRMLVHLKKTKKTPRMPGFYYWECARPFCVFACFILVNIIRLSLLSVQSGPEYGYLFTSTYISTICIWLSLPCLLICPFVIFRGLFLFWYLKLQFIIVRYRAAWSVLNLFHINSGLAQLWTSCDSN